MSILSIDQGTTGSTAAIIDEHGVCRETANVEFPQIYPRPGWVEHDPDVIWQSVIDAVNALYDKGYSAGDINAVSITNQRETAVVWDRATGRPIHNAIVWQCKRTQDRCRELAGAGHADRIRQLTGLPLDSYFSASKVAWLLDRVEGAREAAEAGRLAFGTVDSWLLYKLSGGDVHVTDYTNASRTMLFDISRREWSGEMLDLFGLPPSLLPRVLPSAGEFARTKRVPFLPDGVPVAGVAGDQQAALFGQGCAAPGRSKNTYGTGCFMLLHTGPDRVDSPHGLITTLACDERGRPAYALEGAIFAAGAAVQWLRDELRIIESAAASETAACSVPDSGGVYFVPAFAGLGTPHWDMEARGAVLGITRGTGRAHIVRAALESLAYQTKEVLDVMERDSGYTTEELRVDGGASRNDFLMQFQADICRKTVARPGNIETTALGSAYLAGIHTGLWDAASLFAERPADRTFTPRMDAAEADALFAGYERAVRRVLTR